MPCGVAAAFGVLCDVESGRCGVAGVLLPAPDGVFVDLLVEVGSALLARPRGVTEVPSWVIRGVKVRPDAAVFRREGDAMAADGRNLSCIVLSKPRSPRH